MAKRKRTPRLGDLKAAPYNPRDIDDDARTGLAASLEEFGDIAGITWNQRTGHLVSGHQRLASLRAEHGSKLRMSGGVIRTPTGDEFVVRVVDWSIEKEKAANVAANSPALAGVFTDDLVALLDDVDDDLFDELRFEKLVAHLDKSALPDPEPPANPAGPDRVVEIECTHAQYETIKPQLDTWRADGISIDVA